jgi:hypothetical protein
VTAANYALGSVAGSAELVVPAGLTIMGSLQAGGIPEPGATRPPVKVEAIDQVVCGLGINQIGLLRVDAEGMSSIYCKEQVKHLRTLIGWCWSTIRSTCANAQSNCSPGVG